jgi:hypothetical protein
MSNLKGTNLMPTLGTLGITKAEIKIIEKRGYSFTDISPKGQKICGVLMIVHDPSKLHDSGYPFIRAFGILKDNKLVDMGWHDHYVSKCPTNTDSWGKNIFRVSSWWNSVRFSVSPSFWNTSSLMLGEDGVWN